ncbi:hypothetical protein IAI10_13145 [Clostridium sp. 19966]|uniref:hypothetical protein n=1 Tax=Clostridium sp. 19966 TaxID=2768166 RepID=UPI0028DEA50A|nr:hypothetical protein [Clostridium sp. 19966]MDT8717612.1 hypothetical protein [Clostridium sp. 19966]
MKKAITMLVIFMKKYIEDILILSGLILIVNATFLLSKIAGFYCMGFILLALGIYLSINPPEKR